jgi:chaperonin GroES
MSSKKRTLSPEDFELLYDNILVKAIDMETIDDKTGLIRSQGYEDKPEVGKVINVGEGRIFDNGTVVPLRIKKGDTVYWNKYSSVKIRLGTEDYYLLREEDIQGYIR